MGDYMPIVEPLLIRRRRGEPFRTAHAWREGSGLADMAGSSTSCLGRLNLAASMCGAVAAVSPWKVSDPQRLSTTTKTLSADRDDDGPPTTSLQQLWRPAPNALSQPRTDQ